MYTMNKTREASEEELLYGLELISMEILKSGTTTLEAKSGYGTFRFIISFKICSEFKICGN
ncbi:unnamed protein product [Anisakis simplex]|uniref:Uncharacterized protein n=1 Tax=Anisakis simplex TaxID=6269 RepID=A0A3P6PH20_ANISI|nr:unnamed protein product [Anisakis simplex]